jgi:hypothetical protein
VKAVYTVIKENFPWVIHNVICELSKYLHVRHQYSIQTQVGGLLYIEALDYHLPDCEIVIYDDETNCLKAISFSERKTRLYEIFESRNNPNDILLVLHQSTWGITNKNDFKFKLKNTTTFTLYDIHTENGFEYFYHKRQTFNQDNLINKMFLRTTLGRGDEKELSKRNIINPLFPKVGYLEYMNMAIQYKIGLSIGSVYEICHRDIEYMAIGLPMLRLEYINKYSPEIIPNYHYISIDREGFEPVSYIDSRGGEKYIEAYLNRFNQAKDDREFLKFISLNANEYYKKNCSPNTRLQTLLSQLEIQIIN